MLVLYIILFIASISFSIYYMWVTFLSLCIFTYAYYLLFVMLKKMSKKISVGFVNTQKTAGRSSKIPVVLRLQNRSKLPVANMIIEIEYYNTLDGDKNTMKINTPLYPDDVQYLTLHVSAKHYGTVRMNIKRCRIVDMLKLFKIRVSTDAASRLFGESTFTIVPDYIPIENNIANYAEMGLETDDYSKTSKGDDPSEIFDIHEYHDGDKINRIHWKLTAKQDKTMVKDYSLPISNSIVLMADLHLDTNTDDYMLVYDTLVEAIASISYYLIENDTPHKVVWYDKKKDNSEVVNVTDEESARLLISLLLQASIYDEPDLSMINYINEPERYKCGHLMYFSPAYNSNLSGVMNDNDLAFRYSYMLITNKKKDDVINDEFAEVVNVTAKHVAESIQEICL